MNKVSNMFNNNKEYFLFGLFEKFSLAFTGDRYKDYFYLDEKIKKCPYIDNYPNLY